MFHPGPMTPSPDPQALALRVRALAREFGFQRCGIADIELGADEDHLRDWLTQGLYGSMDWMARHGDKRSRPAELIPGTVRVISVGLDYGRDPEEAWETLYSAVSHPFKEPGSGKIAVKVINHYGDEVLKVYDVRDAKPA